MIRFKYIVVDFDGEESAILFSHKIPHDTIASPFTRAFVLSAGFVGYNSKRGWYTTGKSLSLGLESREEDSQLLNIGIKS